MPLEEEVEGGEPVLAIDNEKFPCGLAQKANALGRVRSAEAQRLVRKEKDRTRNKGLAHRSFIEVHDLADFPPVKDSLKRFLAPLNTGDKPGHLVVRRFVSLDLLAFEIVATREADAIQEIGGFIGYKVKSSFFLDDARCEHSRPPPSTIIVLPADYLPAKRNEEQLVFSRNYVILAFLNSMSSNPIPSDLSESPSVSSGTFFFINKERLKIWLWWCAIVLLIVACGFVRNHMASLAQWAFAPHN